MAAAELLSVNRSGAFPRDAEVHMHARPSTPHKLRQVLLGHV